MKIIIDYSCQIEYMPVKPILEALLLVFLVLPLMEPGPIAGVGIESLLAGLHPAHHVYSSNGLRVDYN